MIEVEYTATFIKMVQRLEKDLREDVYERVEGLRDPKNHARLKVHALHGALKGFYGFSVNYKLRIVFEKKSSKKFLLHFVGGHEIYD
jgi:mRNA-degrading endonuclease YafQ of YafQ-DinJ toxin-antitoxin module